MSGVKMWAVVRPDGAVVDYTVRSTTAGARNAIMENRYGGEALWSHWLDRGYTVRRVTVTLDPAETESVNNNAPGASGVEDEAASG